MTRDQNAPSTVLKLVAKDGRAEYRIDPNTRDLDWAILLAHAQDGDRVAYQRLLREITPYIRSLAARRWHEQGDIEDAVQDVLLTIHSIRHTYDPTRPFAPWLTTIANRRLVDRIRRKIRQRGREVVLSEEHEAIAEPAPNIDERPDLRELESAIENLPLAQQQAVRLLKLKELSLKEASTLSGMSIASLKVNMHRALKSLQRLMMPREQP
jgi:RNA polymerase sigma factor (sigma-70 family)